MAKTLKAEGTTGKVAIFTGNEDVFVNPYVDLSRVYFHSDLQYIYDAETLSTTLDLPSRSYNSSVGYDGNVTTLFTGVDTRNALVFIRLNSLPYYGTLMSTLSSYSYNVRSLSFKWTRNVLSTDITVNELFFVRDQNNALPAQTFTITVNIIRIV